MRECQRKVFGNPISKETTYSNLLEITYVCDEKYQNDKMSVLIFVDKENSPMHVKCVIEGIEKLCSDCIR